MAGDRSSGALAAALIGAVAGVVLGAGAAGWIAGERQRAGREADARRIAALEAARSVLEQRVAEESAARAALAAQLEQRDASPSTEPTEPGGSAAPPAAAGVSSEPPRAPVPARTPGAPAGPGGAPAFDPAPVLAAGFAPEEVARFRARLDELELERLYLRDRAAREGWLDTPRFRAESAALGQGLAGLREEFDEGLYDWVLYASGHRNRVSVVEVLSGSAAEAAGLRSGDVIVRYDQRLVLSAGELRDATAGGRAGELVSVEVQRAGDPAPLRVFVPRGPLGVRLEPSRVEPPPAG